jgi:putative transposase
MESYPAIIRLWRNAWEQFTPFLACPPQIPKIVYTTNDRVAELAVPADMPTARAPPRRAVRAQVLYPVIATPRKNRVT